MKKRGKLKILQDRNAEFEAKRMKRLEEKKKKLQTHAMTIRGIQQLNLQLNIREITPKQRHAITLLVDFHHVWSNSYIASQVGVSTQTLVRWRNSPFFLRELDKEITRRKSHIRLDAYRTLHHHVHRGSLKASLAYFKMSGDLKEIAEVKHTGADQTDENLDMEITKLSDELGLTVVKPGILPVSSGKIVRTASGEEEEEGA